jgi:microcystin-dependent protein
MVHGRRRTIKEIYMEPFVGQIAFFPFSFTPRGWARCEGQLLSISQNTALFSLLGTNFGGDGKRTFALPDLRDKAPLPNTGYYIALQGIYPPRS